MNPTRVKHDFRTISLLYEAESEQQKVFISSVDKVCRADTDPETSQPPWISFRSVQEELLKLLLC